MKSGVSFLFLALFGLFLIFGGSLVILPGFAGVETFAFVMTGWIISVCCHEYGHAVTASFCGDTTVETRGYLRLDPRSYIHWNASFVLPLIVLIMGGVALPGAAVLIRQDLITRSWQRSVVALAGPVVTLIIAVACYGIGLSLLSERSQFLSQAFMLLAFFQLMAFIFNMMPVPGLDGFAVLSPWLPQGVIASMRRIGNLAWLRLLAFGLFFFFGYQVIYPLMSALVSLFGVDLNPAFLAYDRFQFWHP